MTEEFQIPIPPSFMALFVPPGKVKPTIGLREMAARYELCEDMAQLLVEPCQARLHEMGLSEDIVLDRTEAGLAGEASGFSAAEAGWITTRLAELLGWPGRPFTPAG